MVTLVVAEPELLELGKLAQRGAQGDQACVADLVVFEVEDQELGQRGGGKMNAKAAAAVAATSDASGTSRMKERNRSGRHAPY